LSAASSIRQARFKSNIPLKSLSKILQSLSKGQSITLNGEVSGVLKATYVFYSDSVLMTTRYVKYVIKGFPDPEARSYIKTLLGEIVRHIYDIHEPPYPPSKSFLLNGGLKYYVYPDTLLPDPIVRQRTTFLVPIAKNTIRILEDRFFKYDASTGILVEFKINAEEGITKPFSRYFFHLVLTSSPNPDQPLESTSLEETFLLALPLIPAFIAVYDHFFNPQNKGETLRLPSL
jgi:hypothetical protein